MTHGWFLPSRPRILAHRGFVPPDAEGVVENSFAAFAAAHAAGVDYIESDCHLTADGAVVLFHDQNLHRVAGDPRDVAQVTERELEELLADRGGLVTLRQALEAFPGMRFNLDVKADAAAEAVGRLVAPHADRVLLTSFSDRRRRVALAAARAAGGRPATSPGRRGVIALLAAVTLGIRPLVSRVLRDVDAVQVPERSGRLRLVTPRMIHQVHRCGVELHVWTINDAATMRRLLALGVDGIVTDRTDRAFAVVRNFP